MKTLIYAVATRYGRQEFTSLAAAKKCARDEKADGWPTRIEDMRTGAEK